MASLTRPLRVEVVASKGGFGGAERFLLSLLDHAEPRLELSLVALGDAGLIPSAEARGWPISRLRGGPGAFDVLRDCHDLARLWRRDPPDVVIANGVRAAASAVPAGCLSPPRVAWMKHDFFHDGARSRVLGRLADLVIANSAEVADATGRTDAVILCPPRPDEPLDRASADARLRELGVPAGPLRAATLGRLVPYKGNDDAIGALSEAGAWHLVVIGADDPADPGERARLTDLAVRAGVTDRVHFVGEVPDAARILSALDAVLVPTKTGEHGGGREGYGMVADEAMVAGVPLVATTGGPLAHRIGGAGLAIAPGSRPELAAALTRLSDPELRSRLGEEGRRRAAQLPPIDDTASRFVSELAAVAARPGAGLDSGPPMSIVIPVHRDETAVDEVVKRLGVQLRSDDELVLAVDEGASERTARSIDQAAAEGHVVVQVPPGGGPSPARNHGVRAARHEVIACTDAGCEPGPSWLDGLRAAFGDVPRPELVTGVYRVQARTVMEQAFDVACYPDISEARGTGLAAHLYGRVLGRAFEASLPTGRSVAFTRRAWERVGGFPEDLRTAEDVMFGTRIVEAGLPIVLTADAEVTWEQRPTLRDTAHMYYRYGLGDAASRNPRLVARNLARAAAYVGAPWLLIRGGTAGRLAVAAGAAAYLSLPLARVRRRRLSPSVGAAVPVALAVKDLAKAAGCVRGLLRSGRD